MADPKFHLFIDTNIYLSFFSYTNDDLEELRKVAKLIEAKELKLYITQQVRDEFYRNRESKLSTSIAQFEKSSATQSIPRFMHSYPSIAAYRKALNELKQAQNEAIQQAQKEAKSKTIAADTLFDQLTDAAKLMPITEHTYSAALRRMRVGNPPGKEGSLGDRLNWETLLEQVPDGLDIHVASKDGDFESSLHEGYPHGFLSDEWHTRKKAVMHLHREIKPFLAAHFPGIKFAIDVEKRLAIDKLTGSFNFANTHSAVAGLNPFVDALSPAEVIELLEAALTNSQIRLIAQDEDVREFYLKIFPKSVPGKMSPDHYHELEVLFGLKNPPPPVEFDNEVVL